MKKFKYVILKMFVLVIGLAISLCLVANVSAATVTNGNLTLHEQTKVYSSNNSDYFNGCEDYANYVNQAPEITVLTHGLGSKACYWSNDISVNNGDELAYNSKSLIDKIYQKLNGNVLIYFAHCDSPTSFQLTQLSRTMTEIKQTERLDDVSKHIILIYESSIANASNNDVYNEFEYVLDTISMQYKSLTGVLPVLNLVGHSRGGVTNIMYATEHPYNVSSMYSLGTPFNGSALGGIDAVLKMLGYYDESAGALIPGVQSLLDYNEAVNIRNAWNKAYKADVNMNVVAYGSMTSIDYIEAMLYDAANGNSEYADLIKPYMNILKTVLNVVRKNANTTGTVLDFVRGIARVSNAFGINLYDKVLSFVSSDLEGSVTYEEGQKILSLYNVINGQAVIMDDLFIDLNSQLGYGFKDGVEFNGFKRYVKIFNVEDLTANRSIPNMPAVVHNLETMNETYTNEISNSLVYGIHSSNVITLGEDSTTAITLVGERAFKFSSSYTGTRKFTASGTSIKIYMYNSTNGLDLLTEAQNTITFEFQSNQKYMIVVGRQTKGSVNVSFNLLDVLSLGDNILQLSPGSQRVFKTTIGDSGYYLVSSSTSLVKVTGATNYATGQYYAYFQAGTTSYIYLTNTASYNVTANLSISEPESIEIEDEQFTVGSTQKVMEFTNPYNQSIQYKLKIDWTSSTSKSAAIYNQSNSSIASVILSSKTNTYSFTLGANQRCYIIFSDNASTIKANLSVNTVQLRWKINGTYSDTSTTLARNNIYTLDLVLYSNGKELDHYSSWACTQNSSYFSLSYGRLGISYNALIGYDIVIVPTVAAEYLLTITIGFDNQFSYAISNGDTINLHWNIALYSADSLQGIKISIVSGGKTFNITLIATNGVLNLRDYISETTGTSTIYVTSVIISGKTFYNGENCLDVGSLSVNNLYGGGSGTSSSPYTISCYRHLNNIRKNTYSYYKLTSNIDLSGKGDWDSIPSFNGNINGNYYTIQNMSVNVAVSGGDYGFIKYNYGTLTNIKFSGAKIYTTVSEVTVVMYIGIVSGYNSGTVTNCDVSNSSIDVRFYRSRVGGICGYNYGTIYDSDFSNSTMKVSGNAGGIVGYNTGTVDWSYATWVDITYYYNTGTGYIGGICGYNSGTAQSSCASYITILYGYSSSTGYIGGSVGYNTGSVDSCDVSSSTLDVQFYGSRVGGIVGYNTGTVYNSDFSNSNMKVSGNAGGIVGYNTGTVDYSYARNVEITYYWNDDNGHIGGIIGHNTGTVTRCNASVSMKWTSPSNNSSILPCLGYIIGYNSGTYSSCSTGGSSYDYSYKYWHFFIGWFDQSGRCFSSDNSKVGYNA